MYASNLEEALYLLMDKSEASHADPSEFRARMESLRGYGRLPRGRENHTTLLTDEQIADAIWASPQSNLDGPDMWPSFCGR